jgi:hypothetical protein
MTKWFKIGLGVAIALIVVGLVVLGQTHTYSTSGDPTTGDTTCGSVFGGGNADRNGSDYGSSLVQDFCDRQRRHAATQGGIEIAVGVACIMAGAWSQANASRESPLKSA